jgi:hypothetical protein
MLLLFLLFLLLFHETCVREKGWRDEVEHKPPTHTDILVLGTPITTRLPKINPRITAARAAPKCLSIQWLPLHHLAASTDSVERFNQSGRVLNLFKPARRPKMDGRRGINRYAGLSSWSGLPIGSDALLL